MTTEAPITVSTTRNARSRASLALASCAMVATCGPPCLALLSVHPPCVGRAVLSGPQRRLPGPFQ
eukprot:8222484-Alexandrium_andersonii.AAC.1